MGDDEVVMIGVVADKAQLPVGQKGTKTLPGMTTLLVAIMVTMMIEGSFKMSALMSGSCQGGQPC